MGMRECRHRSVRLLWLPPGLDSFPSKAMKNNEQAIDHLEMQIPGLSAAAVDVAYWQALAAGRKVLVSEDGGIYEVSADGSRKFVKAMAERLSVPVGTRVRIP